MIYRKVAKFVVAAFAAAFLCVGADGSSVVAQQNYGVGCSSCSNCSQTISFPSNNVSSMPFVASGTIYPAGQIVYSSPVTQTFPTSSFVGSTFVDSTFSNPVYPSQVNESLPATTYASGSEIVSDGSLAVPSGTIASGTFTSMPAPSYAQPATSYSVPAPSYAQPAAYYVQPSPVTQPVYYPSARPTPVRSTMSSGYRTISNGVATVSSGLAQMKAQQAANGTIRGHIGGGLGGARYEGVGWSNQSPQAAIQQCCYWGQRPTAQIGVSRGADGLWYACVLYN